ncbi:MAG: ABC transporter permease subunit [Caldilineaceae bacterium]
MSALVQRNRKSQAAPRLLRYIMAGGLLLVAALLWHLLWPETESFPESWNVGLRAPLDAFQSWVIGSRATHPAFLYFFNPLKDLIETSLRGIERLLRWLPWPVHFILLYAIAYRARGHRVAIFSSIGLLLMGLFGLWNAGIATFTLIVFSVLTALVVGIPLGVLAAHSTRLERLLRPLLDAMQTMPAFVYLIPVVLFFGLARTPSVVATVIYALPPAIRLTTLGIRQVDTHILEAANAFGATPWQKLRQVQLPLAMPSILLGVNQTIMMALGIVVIAALIGAGGLGQAVMEGLQRLRVGQALEAGLAIVLMAIIFDRISQGFSQSSQRAIGRRVHAVGPPTHLFANLQQNISPVLYHYVYWSTVMLFVLILVVVDFDGGALRGFPEAWRWSIREPVDAAVRWMRDNLYQIGELPIGTGPFSDWVTINLLNPLRTFLLTTLPWPLTIVGIAIVAHHAGGRRLALFSSCLPWAFLGMWQRHGYPRPSAGCCGLFCVLFTRFHWVSGRHDTVEWILRPILDFFEPIPGCLSGAVFCSLAEACAGHYCLCSLCSLPRSFV